MHALKLICAGLMLVSPGAFVQAAEGTPMPDAAATAGATPEPTPESTPTPDQTPVVMGIVADFHRAVEEGYREGVIRLLDENLIVFETGFVEASRAEYVGSHLDADLQYAITVKRQVVHSEAMVSGNVAFVLSQTRNMGEFAGQKINLSNTETMVLRLGPDGWKIAHIHWSGHELKDVPAQPAATPAAQ